MKITIKSTHSQQSVASIGNFDGLHLGHLALLEQMSQYAKTHNLKRVLISFEPLAHEFFSIRQNTPPKARILLLRDKIRILQELDLVDEILIIRFNSRIAGFTPPQFIEYLQAYFKLHTVLLGYDFHFARNRSGSKQDFSNSGIQTIEFAEYLHEGVRISSSLIRQVAQDNDLNLINKYLGRNLCFTSRVVYGNQIGKKYGVPTINLNIGRKVPIIWGIYVAHVYIENICYQAVASIGINPSINDSKNYKVEAHLLDIDLNLYGKIATIEILHFLRPELKFTQLDELFKQIQIDLQQTRDFFRNSKNGL